MGTPSDFSSAGSGGSDQALRSLLGDDYESTDLSGLTIRELRSKAEQQGAGGNLDMVAEGLARLLYHIS